MSKESRGTSLWLGFGNVLLDMTHIKPPGSSDSKASAYNAGDPGSIPGLKDPLEKAMETHSSTLAWRIPGTGECGGLPSMGLHRVEHS